MTPRGANKVQNCITPTAALMYLNDGDYLSGRLNALDALLDDVVAILVLDAAHDVALDLLGNHPLLLQGQHFQGFLNDSATIHLQRESKYMPSDGAG